MSRRRVVVTGTTFPGPVRGLLEAGGFSVETLPGDLTEGDLVAALDGAWAYVLGGSEHMSKRAWKQLPDLAVACFLGTGHSDFVELPDEPSPIRFTYTPYANAVAVAEFTLALMLDVVRGVSRTADRITRGAWTERTTPSLVGARLGIAGMGHIGREVARMAHQAFGAEIYYWNRSRRPELDVLPYAAVSSLTDLFEATDVVSLSLALEPGVNDGIVGAEHLAALGSDGFVVNCARAALIDPAALRDALAEGAIAGAAMDGYYIEPTPEPGKDPYGLLRFVPDRLIVTPHCAYLSTQAMRRMADMAAECILAVARGAEPPHRIPAAAAAG